jgi:[ribosomal protein S18]-alanine N-acetyltransferase
VALCFAPAYIWNMVYRLFHVEDFDDLYAIEEVCFQPPFRFARRYMRQLVESLEAATWIAEANGQMAGFAIVEWSQQNSGVYAYIATIEVLPDLRGKGIGVELLRRVEASAHAEGAVEVWLHVDAENALAIRLYQTSGYRYAGRAENYYARGRAAEVYMKQLIAS